VGAIGYYAYTKSKERKVAAANGTAPTTGTGTQTTAGSIADAWDSLSSIWS
jgi:hypothetical protein